MWQVFTERSPFPDIPSVMAGLDARPMILAGQIQAPDKGGWPLLNGHRTWFVTTPAEVGGLLRYAVSWVQAHPSVRVEPAPSPPVVMLESWNELQEGAIIVPTEQNGYGYGQAIAKALGVPWAPLHEQALRVVASRRGTVKSSPARIFCPPRCTSMFAGGVQVSLTARAKRGFRLDHWKGCTDTDPTCSVVLVRDSTVQPIFAATR